jgi:coatomer protein complex subunit gamma
MLQAIERYMKQAIVDRNCAVSSAALVSSLHLTKIAGDVVKRWVNEAQEAVNSDRYLLFDILVWLLQNEVTVGRYCFWLVCY